MSNTFDLLVSHNQICIRSKNYEEADHEWGRGNVAQGFLLHPKAIIADPLIEGTFGANVTIKICQDYEADPCRQRAAAIPLIIEDGCELTIYSASEEFKVPATPTPGRYQVYFEVCLNEEVFYKFTLIKSNDPKCIGLMDDGWGLKKDKELKTGKF